LKNTEKVISDLTKTENKVKKWIAEAEKFHKQTVVVKKMTRLSATQDELREMKLDEQVIRKNRDLEKPQSTGATSNNTEDIDISPGRSESRSVEESKCDSVIDVQPELERGSTKSNSSRTSTKRKDPTQKLRLDRTALKQIQAKIKEIKQVANQAKGKLQKERLEWKRAQRKYIQYQAKALKCDEETDKKKKEKYEKQQREWQAKEAVLKEKQAAHMNELHARMMEIKAQVDQRGSLSLIKEQLESIRGIQEAYFEECQDVVLS